MKLFRLLTLAATLSCSFTTIARAHDGAQANPSQVANDNHPAKKQEPEIKEQPEPSSEHKIKSATWEGDIIVRVLLRANGKVSDITILKGGPRDFNKAVIEAAKRIKFVPAEKDGQAVSQWVTLKYTFTRSNEDQK